MSEKSVRYPKPWCVLENEDSFVVEDAAGTVLSRVAFLVEGRRSAAGSMSKDEARRIAENMVRMTDILVPSRLA